MDPNETWKRMTEYSEAMIETIDEGGLIESEDAEELAELVLALKGWIEGGGFPPKVFRKEK